MEGYTMSALYGWLDGKASTTATRAGSANSGIRATVSGWRTGVRVIGYIDSDGNECFDVYRTSGSADGNSTEETIATVKESK